MIQSGLTLLSLARRGNYYKKYTAHYQLTYVITLIRPDHDRPDRSIDQASLSDRSTTITISSGWSMNDTIRTHLAVLGTPRIRSIYEFPQKYPTPTISFVTLLNQLFVLCKHIQKFLPSFCVVSPSLLFHLCGGIFMPCPIRLEPIGSPPK
jgi:hypothetical protein